MAVRKILLFPDRILSAPCETLKDFDPSLTALIGDLIDTLEAGPGVGIAAPQIGVSKRVSVINTARKKKGKETAAPIKSHGLLILINPVLMHGSGIQTPREGCLSVPDMLANVRRYEKVAVRAQTVTGDEQLIRAEGFEALALQHEMDHLDGKLFLDRVSNLKTDLFRRKTY